MKAHAKYTMHDRRPRGLYSNFPASNIKNDSTLFPRPMHDNLADDGLFLWLVLPTKILNCLPFPLYSAMIPTRMIDDRVKCQMLRREWLAPCSNPIWHLINHVNTYSTLFNEYCVGFSTDHNNSQNDTS